MKSQRYLTTDVAIAGAGPVGSFLACLLGSAGLRVRVFEQREKPPDRSMAIGIMPVSLRRFAAIGLDARIIREGTAVQCAVVHDAKRELGRLSFATLPGPHDYIVTLPQSTLVSILWQRLRALPNVTFATGMRVEKIDQSSSETVADICPARGGHCEKIRCGFFAVCDGAHGSLRGLLGVDTPVKPYGMSFVMGDAGDETGWGNVAHLFFTPGGSLESFPLPSGRRRWVALADSDDRTETTGAQLCRRVRKIAAVRLREADLLDSSRFTPQRRLVRRYVKGRIALCGDAAHVMSPIGGQGMNTGLADAWHFAAVLVAATGQLNGYERLLAGFERDRRLAFRHAARRAACSMWIGTRRGRGASGLRSWIVRGALSFPAATERLAALFSMWTIPEGTDPVLHALQKRLIAPGPPAPDQY